MANGQFNTAIKRPQYDEGTGKPLYNPATGRPLVKHRCPVGPCGICQNYFPPYTDPLGTFHPATGDADYDSPGGFCITFANVQVGEGYPAAGTCYCNLDGSAFKRFVYDDWNRTWWAGTFAGDAVTGYAYCAWSGVNVIGDGFNVTGNQSYASLADCAAGTAPADPNDPGVHRDFTFGVTISFNATTGRRFLLAYASPAVFAGIIELTDDGCMADAGYVVPNQLIQGRYPCPVGVSVGSLVYITGWSEAQPAPPGCGTTPCTRSSNTADDGNGGLLWLGFQNCRTDGQDVGTPNTETGFVPVCELAEASMIGTGGYAFLRPRINPGVPSACDADTYICTSIYHKRYNCFTRTWEATVHASTQCVVGFVQGWQLLGTTYDGAIPYRNYLAVTSSGPCTGYGDPCEQAAAPADPDFDPGDCPECSACAPCCDDLKINYLHGGTPASDVVSRVAGCDYVGATIIIECTNGVRVMTIPAGGGHATFHQVDSGAGCLLLFDTAWAKTEDTTSGGVTLPEGTMGECAACPTDYSACCQSYGIAITIDGVVRRARVTLSGTTFTSSREDLTLDCSGGKYRIIATGTGKSGEPLEWDAVPPPNGCAPTGTSSYVRAFPENGVELAAVICFGGCVGCCDEYTVTGTVGGVAVTQTVGLSDDCRWEGSNGTYVEIWGFDVFVHLEDDDGNYADFFFASDPENTGCPATDDDRTSTESATSETGNEVTTIVCEACPSVISVLLNDDGECDDGVTITMTYDPGFDAWLSPSGLSYVYWNGTNWEMFLDCSDMPGCNPITSCCTSSWAAADASGDHSCPPLIDEAWTRWTFACGSPTIGFP